MQVRKIGGKVERTGTQVGHGERSQFRWCSAVDSGGKIGSRQVFGGQIGSGHT